MRNKIIKISAVVLAIALLLEDYFLSLRDDVQVKIQEEKNQSVCARFYTSGSAGKK